MAKSPDHRGSVYSQPANRTKAAIDRDNYSGIHGFLGSEMRLDLVLREASRISVRPEKEGFSGSSCAVIDADTRYGRYAVWIDPEHGYQAAKVTRGAKAPHIEIEDEMPVGDCSTGLVEVTRFEQLDGVWVPMGAIQQTTYTALNRQAYNKVTSRFQRTTLTLNPDHEKLGSFDDPLVHPANDPELRNGARVNISGAIQARGSWQDGKVVNAQGEVLFDGKGRRTGR